jgi:hypothetical protein
MSTGTPPTEFEFPQLPISPPVTLVTEKPAEKDQGMLEQRGNPSQSRSRAKAAAEQRKSSNAGP